MVPLKSILYKLVDPSACVLVPLSRRINQLKYDCEGLWEDPYWKPVHLPSKLAVSSLAFYRVGVR
jgi:hypothetical protein